MHREMGMNVLRLWGGNGGASRGLWDAADEQVSGCGVACGSFRTLRRTRGRLIGVRWREARVMASPGLVSSPSKRSAGSSSVQGVMIFQEFWQSGVSRNGSDCLAHLQSQPYVHHTVSQDNNGRWAGSQSWPLDHPGYLLAAADTIRMARGHASLLLYNAGNEIFPPNETWAPAPLSALATNLDPRGTPFEWSSMGNITEWWDPEKVGATRHVNASDSATLVYTLPAW
jgi:hypothetical protein